MPPLVKRDRGGACHVVIVAPVAAIGYRDAAEVVGPDIVCTLHRRLRLVHGFHGPLKAPEQRHRLRVVVEYPQLPGRGVEGEVPWVVEEGEPPRRNEALRQSILREAKHRRLACPEGLHATNGAQLCLLGSLIGCGRAGGRRRLRLRRALLGRPLDNGALRISLPEQLVDEGLQGALHLPLPEVLPHALAVVQHHVGRMLVGEEQVLQAAVGVVDELQVGAVLALQRRPAAAHKIVHPEFEAGKEGRPGASALLGSSVAVCVAAERRRLIAPGSAVCVVGGDDRHVALPAVPPEVEVREAVRPLCVWVALAELQLLA